ncbi:MAG: phosphodiesterase, partial [Campylobacterota bacterium]|nr:phosphodiesterase [Campylobacterota bacterium]
LKEKDIPFEARIITVADIFQALVQDRPYRAGLSAEKACLIIENMKDEGKLDVSIVQKLRKNLEDSYAYARVEYQNFKQ